MVKIGDLVTKGLTIEPQRTVAEAAKLMNGKNVTSLIVVESGKAVGIVTDRSFRRRFVPMNKPSDQVTVTEVMFKPIVTVDAKVSAKDAARLLVRKKITRIAVVKDGKIEGLIGLADLAKHLTKKSFLGIITGRWSEKEEEIPCPKCRVGSMRPIYKAEKFLETREISSWQCNNKMCGYME